MQKRYFQLSADKLIEHTLDRNEGVLADNGALVINTGKFTGRSPEDKFIVSDTLTENVVDWNKFNNPISTADFLLLKREMTGYLDTKAEIWTRYAFASSKYAIGIHIINEFPAHNLFAANMFITPDIDEIALMQPEWTILHAPGFKAIPAVHGTRSQNFTVISFTHKTILIGGTAYTGEIKKSVFTLLNFILPLNHSTLSMHCSANRGSKGDTALFFGLSGTGKTTLSSDPDRLLIGDDEHGWDAGSIFNFEGGCYAKTADLSEDKEPLIFNAVKKGALVENTVFFPGTNTIDFSNKSITENTRASYPLSHITNAYLTSPSPVPNHIFFLSCDAYGVLPPICKLTAEQAAFYFLSGYTAKIAGTETSVIEPRATFSPCFGAPFLPLKPAFYAGLFIDKIRTAKSHVWMINTGWIGGPYGKGRRISLKHTRLLLKNALNGTLEKSNYHAHPTFDVALPVSCPGVPGHLLTPWKLWKDENAYFAAASELKVKFAQNTASENQASLNQADKPFLCSVQ